MEYAPTVALSDALNFAPKQPAVASRATRVVVNPINSGSQYPGNVIKWDLPVGMPGKYLDCSETYMLFQVQNADASNACVVSGSAYAFFNRMDTLSGGQVLESVQNYGLLCNTLLDLQMGSMCAATSGSISMGMSSPAANNVDKTGLSIAANTTVDFAVPVALNGIIGSNNRKLFPISKVSDLRLEMTVESAAQAVVSTSTAANWTILNPTLVLTYVDIDAHMAREIEASNGGHYQISTQSYRNYNSTLVANRTADSILIPARYSSVAGCIHLWRDSATIGVQSAYGLTARSNPFASATNAQCQIQYIIGSTNVPQTPIKFGVSETWLNTQAFLHQLDDIDNPSRCTLANWSAPNYTAAGAAQGTFCFGQNMCSFIGKTSSMTSGMNTINSPIFLNVQYPAQVTTAQRIDTFVLYDVILDISDNGLMCRF